MSIKIAFNGFGRIGRMAFRHIIHDDRFKVVHINEIAPAESLAHSIKYDSIHGQFAIPVTATPESITVNGNLIEVSNISNIDSICWEKSNVDIVIDCSGQNNNITALQKHINSGVKIVIASAPVKNVKNIVYGINEDTITSQDQIISVASCTTNCLAPVAYHLHHYLGIIKGHVSTIHAYTKDQTLLDSFHHNGDLRRGRAAAYNIIPTRTGAAKAIGWVIPELEGKLDGCSIRVPVLSGSFLQMTALVERRVSSKEINEYMKSKVSDTFGYTEDEIVSSDIINMTYGSYFDATQTQVYPVGEKSLVYVAAWYDNEFSYATQLYRTLCHISTKFRQ